MQLIGEDQILDGLAEFSRRLFASSRNPCRLRVLQKKSILPKTGLKSAWALTMLSAHARIAIMRPALTSSSKWEISVEDRPTDGTGGVLGTTLSTNGIALHGMNSPWLFLFCSSVHNVSLSAIHFMVYRMIM